MTYLEKLLSFLTNLLMSLTIFLVFYLLAYYGKRWLKRSLIKIQIKTELTNFAADTLFFTILTIGILLGLNILGINTNAIIASLGLGGFAIGFAIKDIIANAAAGFLILVTKPFKTGDHIKITNFEGTIKSINLRYTIITTKNNEANEKIMIPNNNLLTNILIIKKVK